MSRQDHLPVWYELISDDADGAERFYRGVLGWTFERPPGGLERDYRIFSAADGAVGGLMQRPAGTEMPLGWRVYISVSEVDALAEKIGTLGGAVHFGPMDIPGVGRFAVVSDPLGAVFNLMRGDSAEPSRSFMQGEGATPGHAVWNELTSPDPQAALAFYGALFGWRQEGSMPMGELGEYRFLYAGSTCLGAVMGRVPKGRDGWQFYFMTDDIDAAVARLRSSGGSVIQGPDQIPGGSYAVVAEDPSGSRFGLVGARKDGEGA